MRRHVIAPNGRTWTRSDAVGVTSDGRARTRDSFGVGRVMTHRCAGTGDTLTAGGAGICCCAREMAYRLASGK